MKVLVTYADAQKKKKNRKNEDHFIKESNKISMTKSRNIKRTIKKCEWAIVCL